MSFSTCDTRRATEARRFREVSRVSRQAIWMQWLSTLQTPPPASTRCTVLDNSFQANGNSFWRPTRRRLRSIPGTCRISPTLMNRELQLLRGSWELIAPQWDSRLLVNRSVWELWVVCCPEVCSELCAAGEGICIRRLVPRLRASCLIFYSWYNIFCLVSPSLHVYLASLVKSCLVLPNGLKYAGQGWIEEYENGDFFQKIIKLLYTWVRWSKQSNKLLISLARAGPNTRVLHTVALS